MKPTIELPDDLYRKVEAKSALQGRPLGAVAEELFRRWLEEDASAADVRLARARDMRSGRDMDVPPAAPDQSAERSGDRWLATWFRLADEAFASAPPGPTAREILEQDRGRLDRR